MEILLKLADILLHVDKYLSFIIQSFGLWSYAVLFVVIFAETGFVVTPFLPGDSLLFAVGAFSAIGDFDPILVTLTVSAAAILGDTVNYWIGYIVGPKVFHGDGSRFFKKEYLIRTHEFYEKHGGKTIFLARYIPIIRTFAPFVAGIGRMSYLHFITYNIVGGITWPVVFISAGYFFGNIPLVKQYFSLVIVVIVILSVLPIAYEVIRSRRNKAKNQ
ncbi:MAG: DedA family protein [Spirochaetes bacterium]|jgi:membrane-associated protein|nr:DedA family protein [Spirochaetota bacterium]